jgi:hypothetical protein
MNTAFEYSAINMPAPQLSIDVKPKDDFTIHIKTAKSRFGTHVAIRGNEFFITIDEEQISEGGHDKLSALVHELGHAVAAISGLSHNRVALTPDFKGLNTYPEELLETEKEAWFVASLIFNKTRQHCLSSYEKEAERWRMPDLWSFGDKP